MSALSSMLVQNQKLSVTQIEQALQRQVILGGDLPTVLLELGMLGERVLVEYESRSRGMTAISVEDSEYPDAAALAAVPMAWCVEHRVIPLQFSADGLLVAVAGQLTAERLSVIQEFCGVPVHAGLVLEFRLALLLKRCYGVALPGRMASLQRKVAPDFDTHTRPLYETIEDSRREEPAPTPPAEVGTPPASVREEAPAFVVESSRTESLRGEGTQRFYTVVKGKAAAQPKAAPPIEKSPVPAITVEDDDITLQGIPVEKRLEPLPVEAGGAVQPSGLGSLMPSQIPGMPAPSSLISFSEASSQISGATERNEILDIFFKFASQAFEFSILALVHSDSASVRTAVDRKGPVEAESLEIPLNQGGMFENVIRTRGLHAGPPTDTEADRTFYANLARSAPESCAIITVVLKQRVMLLLYGDSGDKGVRPNRVSRLAEFARLVEEAFERILLSRKYGQFRTDRPSTVPGPIPEATSRRSSVPPRAVRDLSAWALPPQIRQEITEQAPTPAPAASPSSPPSPIVVSELSFPPPPEHKEQPDTLPPDPPVKLAEPRYLRSSDASVKVIAPISLANVEAPQTTGPDANPRRTANLLERVESLTVKNVSPPQEQRIPRSKGMAQKVEVIPSVDDYLRETIPRVFDSKPPAAVDFTDAGRYGLYAPREEDARPTAEIRPSSPPPVPLDGTRVIDEPIPLVVRRDSQVPTVADAAEIETLIQRVLTGEGSEEAAHALVRIGDAALIRIMQRFPGPIIIDRYREMGRLPRVMQHGPLLKTLVMFGHRVLPYIQSLYDSYDSEVRFYSVYLLCEIGTPSVVKDMVRRVFDNDRQIRSISLDVIFGFTGTKEFDAAIQEIAEILLANGSPLERKRLAAEALGYLRDVQAIPSLARMLGSVDAGLSERSQQALVQITFNDFGFSEKRWSAWYEANRAAHRIEWAMESLSHRVEDIRRLALEELRRLVGDRVEWPRPPFDSRQLREVRRRCAHWWETEGRALNIPGF